MGKNFFVVIILLLICIDAFAQTYYVRPAANGGSDANDGRSPATAFATIGHFAQITVRRDGVKLLTYVCLRGKNEKNY